MDTTSAKILLKQVLWLIAPCVIGCTGLAWHRWHVGAAVGDGRAFLLPTLVAGALTVTWLVLLIVFLVTKKRGLKQEEPAPRNRLKNLPWWTLKILSLAVVLAVMAVMISRLSVRVKNEFTLLKEGRLVQLEEHIVANPAVLKKRDAKSGMTLLQLALKSGNAEAVELLLSNGEELAQLINAQNLSLTLNNLSLLEVLLRHGVDPNVLDADGFALIHYVIEARNADALTVLLEAGADVDTRDPLYRTPLILAVMADGLPMAEALLKAGADPDQYDSRGDTALHQAVQRRNIETAQLLLDQGADPQAFNFSNMAPIHIAALQGQNHLVELFLTDPVMVNLSNDDDRTPFDYTLRGHKYETARLLLRHGAEIDRVMADGYTAAHFAVIAKDYHVVEFLIGEGANVHIDGPDGETAHDLMRTQQVESLLDLIEARDNPTTTNTVESADSP